MDVLSPESRRATMKAVKGKDTKPELAIRQLIHRLGFRFRLHDGGLPGKPDIVFPARRKVIFVHGCFWHQHRCPAAARPSSRREYWDAKLDGNMARDRHNQRRLRNMGWSSLVVWECQLKRTSFLEKRLVNFLNKQE